MNIKDIQEPILFCSANYDYLPLLLNWYESAKRVGIERFVLVNCLDDKLKREMEKRDIRHVKLDVPANTKEDMFHSKLRCARILLEHGKNFLMSDVDVVFLRDPFMHILKKVDDADIIGQTPHPRNQRDYINSGFFYVVPNENTLELFNTNDELTKGLIKEFGYKDQRILNEKFRHIPVKVVGLNMRLFPNGPTWINDRRHIKNNFIVHFTSCNKLQEMTKSNMWYIGQEWLQRTRSSEFKLHYQELKAADRIRMETRTKMDKNRIFKPRIKALLMDESEYDESELRIFCIDNGADDRVIEAQRKVFDKFKIQLHHMPISDRYQVDDLIRTCSSKYVILIEPDVIPLRDNVIRIVLSNIKHNDCVMGISQQNNLKSDTRVYVGPGFIAFSKELYNTINKPSLCETSESGYGALVSRAASSHGIALALIYPTDVRYPRWGSNKLRFGIGTTYGNMIYKTHEIWKPRYIQMFLDKCDDTLRGTM